MQRASSRRRDEIKSKMSGRSSTDEHVLEQWTRQERENAERKRKEELRARYQDETNPQRRTFHQFIAMVSFVAVCSALNMAAGQFVGYVFQKDGPVQYVLRLYVVALSFLAILVEVEWTKFARESAILRIWITRGLFYAFIGVLGLEQNDTEPSQNIARRGFDISRQYIRVVAWMMVGIGSMYSMMGMLCLQIYYNRLRADYENRVKRAKDIRETTERYIDTDQAV